MKVEEVVAKHEDELMSIPGVAGVGVSESAGQPVITIMVNQLTPELKAKLPADLDGVRTKIDVVGEVRAF